MVRTSKEKTAWNMSEERRFLEITIQADSYFKAKEMIEAQYGKGCIFSGPTESR